MRLCSRLRSSAPSRGGVETLEVEGAKSEKRQLQLLHLLLMNNLHRQQTSSLLYQAFSAPLEAFSTHIPPVMLARHNFWLLGY